MAKWLFEPPTIALPYGQASHHGRGLWSRVFIYRGITIVRKKDGTWESFSGDIPQQFDSAAEHHYGPKGFSVTEGTVEADYGWEGCDRLYRGGHRYIIGTDLYDELTFASTTDFPSGFGQYCTQVDDLTCITGDEILASGRTSWLDQDRYVDCGERLLTDCCIDPSDYASLQLAAEAAFGSIIHIATGTVTIPVGPARTHTTIQDALDAIARWTIRSPGKVIIQCDAFHGTKNDTNPFILFTHPFGHGIEILGATPLSRTMSSIVSVAGTAGSWTVVAQLDSVTGVTAGDMILITGTAPGAKQPGLITSPVAKGDLQLGYFACNSGAISTSGTTGTLLTTAGGAAAHTGILEVNDLIHVGGATRQITALPTSNTITFDAAFPADVTVGQQYWFFSKPNPSGAGAGITTVGTTVTSSSGTGFANVNVGDMIITDGGWRRVVSKTSDQIVEVNAAWRNDIAVSQKYSVYVHGLLHDGCWEISSVDTGTSRVTFTNKGRGVIAPPVGGVTSTAVKILTTTLKHSSSGGGIHVRGAYLSKLSAIGLIGPFTDSPSTAGLGVALGGSVSSAADASTPGRPGWLKMYSDCGVLGFAYAARVEVGSLWASGAFFCGGGKGGFFTEHGATANISGATIAGSGIDTGSNGTGLYVGPGTEVHGSDIRSHSNKLNGVWCDTGGALYSDFGWSYNNLSNGIYLVGGATCQWVGCRNHLNDNYGIQTTNSASGRFSGTLTALNVLSGAQFYRSKIEASHFRSYGNTRAGMEVLEGEVAAVDAELVGNITLGTHIRNGARVILDDAYIRENSSHGVRADRFSRVILENTYADDNTSADYFAETGAEIYTKTYRGSPTVSPTLNVKATLGTVVTDGTRVIHQATGWSTGSVSIADDAVATITGYDGKNLIITVWTTDVDAAGSVHLRVGASAFAELIVSAGDVEASTAVLAGTTGTDVKLTVSANTNGNIYIENRLGSTVTVQYNIQLAN